MISVTPREVLVFWFVESGIEQWFEKDAAFDTAIRDRFAPAIAAAREGRLQDWVEDAKTCLALIILIDQFSRNVFRLSPLSWSADGRALAVSKTALERGYDETFDIDERKFLYMPFMHSEALADQERCVALFTALNDVDSERADKSHEFAIRHRDIVARFGRFPHRNAVLGRTSTAAEIAFLLEPDSSF